jgi:hypothetical protein
MVEFQCGVVSVVATSPASCPFQANELDLALATSSLLSDIGLVFVIRVGVLAGA